MTIANLITASRIVSVPLILASAWFRRPGLFAGLVIYALLSDAVDGTIARRLGQATPLGARLDSLADAALYLTAPLAALLLYATLWTQERAAVLTVIASYMVPVVVGFMKFRRLTAYHTLGARLAGTLIGAAFVAFVMLRVTWPLRVAAVVLLLSALEELALTLTLPHWRANVPSWLHVRRGSQLPGST